MLQIGNPSKGTDEAAEAKEISLEIIAGDNAISPAEFAKKLEAHTKLPLANLTINLACGSGYGSNSTYNKNHHAVLIEWLVARAQPMTRLELYKASLNDKQMQEILDVIASNKELKIKILNVDENDFGAEDTMQKLLLMKRSGVMIEPFGAYNDGQFMSSALETSAARKYLSINASKSTFFNQLYDLHTPRVRETTVEATLPAPSSLVP